MEKRQACSTCGSTCALHTFFPQTPQYAKHCMDCIKICRTWLYESCHQVRVLSYISFRLNDIFELISVTSQLSYANDTWSTKQMVFSFSGTLTFYIDDNWVCVKQLVDFRHLDIGDHTDVCGARAFVDSACKRGRLNKIGHWSEMNVLQSSNELLLLLLSCLHGQCVLK